MVQVWTNAEDPKSLTALAKFLDKQAADNSSSQLKTLINVVTQDGDYAKSLLTRIADGNSLKNVHLTYVSPKDTSIADYKINLATDITNTVFVQKRRRVEAKFVNLKTDEEGLKMLSEAIGKVTG
jgi:hypothetical protein